MMSCGLAAAFFEQDEHTAGGMAREDSEVHAAGDKAGAEGIGAAGAQPVVVVAMGGVDVDALHNGGNCELSIVNCQL